MANTTPGIIKSFLPIFYISKLFGCNLYALPAALNSKNVNASLRATDILICLIQFVLHIFVIYPLLNKWDRYDEVFNEEFANKIRSSGLVVIVFIGRCLNYATILTNLLYTIMDMRNSVNIRRILLYLINFDKQVS